jgi:hypothetical protein
MRFKSCPSVRMVSIRGYRLIRCAMEEESIFGIGQQPLRVNLRSIFLTIN